MGMGTGCAAWEGGQVETVVPQDKDAVHRAVLHIGDWCSLGAECVRKNFR